MRYGFIYHYHNIHEGVTFYKSHFIIERDGTLFYKEEGVISVVTHWKNK